MTTTHILETAEADIAYDVRGPRPTVDGRPPLMMIGQPMAASGFDTLASHFPDRTVVTYDPRGLGRSVRRDGRVDSAPTVQADDVHAVIEALGAGPVEMFASSGGAVTALALVAGYPDDLGARRVHRRVLRPAGGGSRPVRPADRGRRLPRGPAAIGPVLGGQQLSPRRRGAGRGSGARRDRRGRGVAEHLHRTHGGRDRRAARPAGDGVPEPPRRLPRRRVRIPRQTRSLRAQATRGPRGLTSISARYLATGGFVGGARPRSSATGPRRSRAIRAEEVRRPR